MLIIFLNYSCTSKENPCFNQVISVVKNNASTKKEGYIMEDLSNGDYFELIYKDQLYEHLEFIRMDTICGKNYVTLMNAITRKLYTFEENNIQHLKKSLQLQPNKFKQKNHLAPLAPYSIY